MRLTKEEFCKAINKYKSMIEAESKMLSAFGTDYFVPSGWIDEYYDLIITMSDIDRVNNNIDFGNDINFFCWELNFGENGIQALYKKTVKTYICGHQKNFMII